MKRGDYQPSGDLALLRFAVSATPVATSCSTGPNESGSGRQTSRDKLCYLSQLFGGVLQEPIGEPDAVAYLVVGHALLGELAEQVAEQLGAVHVAQPQLSRALRRHCVEVPPVPPMDVEHRLDIRAREQRTVEPL